MTFLPVSGEPGAIPTRPQHERKPTSYPTPSVAKTDPAEILGDLRRYDRTPFLRVLADVMGAQPTQQRLAEFASEHPEKWAYMIQTFARLGGFTEKTEIVGSIALTIDKLSDVELRHRIEELERAMGMQQLVEAIPEAPVEA